MKNIIIIAVTCLVTEICFAEKVHFEGSDIYYEILNDTVLVLSGQGAMPNAWMFSPWSLQVDSIKHVVIENGPTTIGRYYFKDLVNIKTVSISNSVTNIGRYAFENCSSLKEVTIPNSVITIERSAFKGCSKLSSLWVPDSVIEIEEAAFHSCTALETLRLSNSMTEISEACFYNNHITHLDIPDQITTIDVDAFIYSGFLRSVKLPTSLTILEEGAFLYSVVLDSIFVLNPTPPLSEFAFGGLFKTPHAIVPNNSVQAYEENVYWGAYGKCIIIGGGYVAFSHTDTDDNKVGGHVIQPEQRFYQPGEEVTFKAQPEEGYRFVNWTTYPAGGSKAEVVVSTDSVYSCTVGEDNIELTANFEKITVSVEETEFSAAQFGFALSPNPANATVNVIFTGSGGTGTVSLSLYDMSGVLVKTWDNIATPNVSLDISHLPAGIYFVTAGNSVQKVIVK
ncbi:MAG: leucine-rich repeat protein [Cytophagaceae bacterium]|nr:leucine-rich repeat protein [Cytophagaceae bacterium]